MKAFNWFGNPGGKVKFSFLQKIGEEELNLKKSGPGSARRYWIPGQARNDGKACKQGLPAGSRAELQTTPGFDQGNEKE